MKKKIIIAVCSSCLLAILAVSYCLINRALEDDVIWTNIEINGVLLKGLTLEEAKSALTQDFENKYTNASLEIVLKEKEYSCNIFPILGFNADKEINQAFQLGHGKWYLRCIDWIKVQLSSDKIVESKVFPFAKYPGKLDQIIKDSGIWDYNSTIESSYEVTENSLIIHKGKEGEIADIEQLKQSILTAIDEKNYSDQIVCQVVKMEPQMPDFQQISNEIYCEAANASLDRENNYKIVPSVRGTSLDTEQADSIYRNTEYGEDAEIALAITEPEITTEDLTANLFQTVLASYTTYGGGTSGRVKNISLAVSSCNGVILLPGDTFSFNDILGERTVEKGYQVAGAYSDGEVIQEVGGGICQVSSTVFSAVLHTNLEIVYRSNHSMPVSYLPLGMDAAVSWGGPDLNFRNNLRYPVKISAKYEGGAITIQLIGTKEYNETIKVTSVETGYLCAETYRNYYDEDGNLISKEKIADSTYKEKKAE